MSKKKKTNLHFQRFEFKYQIPANIAYRILPALLNHMDWDPYAKTKEDNAYEVHSIYLDSPALKNYYEKVEGVLQRKKLRIRAYSKDLTEESPVFFEIKRKYNAVIIKDRIKLSLADAKSMLRGGLHKDDISPSKHDFYDECITEQRLFTMRLNVLVSYKRKPLISRIGEKNLRVTFDYDISSNFCNTIDFTKKTKQIFPGMLVMEVKFNDILPYWLHDIIQQYRLEAWPYSKYANGVESVYRYVLA